MNTFLSAAAIATIAAISPSLAGAAPVTIFSEDFAEEIGGAGLGLEVLNFTALDQFDIVDGAVDLFTDNGFGLPCGSAGCLDLDGSAFNAARLESSAPLSLTAGNTYTISIQLSGKNSGDTETLSFGFVGLVALNFVSLPAIQPAVTETLDFTPTSDITANLFIDHDGGDNGGLLLDSVTVTETAPMTAVPLPATLPLIALGLGALGLVSRRRG